MYSDRELALQMEQLLQNLVVIERPREPNSLDTLLANPTETTVREQLISGGMTDVGLRGKFRLYWGVLGKWLKQNGGDIGIIAARSQPGRIGGNATVTGDKIMYDDAFLQTRKHIGRPFSAAKAISNHLRFINHFK